MLGDRENQSFKKKIEMSKIDVGVVTLNGSELYMIYINS